jgi:hypothetical protein
MRQYLVVNAEKDLLDTYREYDPFGNFKPLTERVFEILSKLKATNAELRAAVLKLRKTVTVVAAPSAIPESPDPQQWSNQLILSLAFPDRESIALLRKFVLPHLAELTGDASALLNIGADPRGHLCTLCPAAPARPFGNRSRIREMMGIKELRDLRGRGVNVVIFDQGLNREEIEAHPSASWGGGLAPGPNRSRRTGATLLEPGTASRASHGMMMARNILDVAPEAKLFDVPLIPPQISRPHVFASTAHATYQAVLDEINQRRKGDPGGAWIFVNAWAIFDRSDEAPKGNYTRNEHEKFMPLRTGGTVRVVGHPLNKLMSTAASQRIDVIFGAGNCGEFTISGRCGPNDRGEGRSIWGANAHPEVLTVGAVSANAEWLGYSSQGPAPWGGAQKPDICAPSHFSEDHDPSVVNSGTSAATGLAAGIIAAVRGNPEWSPDKLSPAALKAKINAAARGPNGTWNSRMGNGMLDARTILNELKKPAPAQPAPATAAG